MRSLYRKKITKKTTTVTKYFHFSISHFLPHHREQIHVKTILIKTLKTLRMDLVLYILHRFVGQEHITI